MMFTRARRALRLGYLAGRAVTHIHMRKQQSPTSVTAVMAEAVRLSISVQPGHELRRVIRCDQCRSVAVIDLSDCSVRMTMGFPGCPVLDAWTELMVQPLPRAKVR